MISYSFSSFSNFSFNSWRAKLTAWLRLAKRFFSTILSINSIISGSKLTLVLTTASLITPYDYQRVFKCTGKKYPIIPHYTEKYIKEVIQSKLKHMLHNKEVEKNDSKRMAQTKRS